MSGREVPRFERGRRLSSAGRGRRRGRRGGIAGAALALALLAAGCGAGRREADGVLHGTHLTIYSSLPFAGPDRPAALDVVRAERLALERDGGEVGRYRVRLVSLDAAMPKGLGWDPGRVSLNARLAAADPRTVAYLGELHAGSSAISIPLLNEAGILEVSPLDTAMELTTPSAGVTGSPERYYPNLKRVGRTFARVVPSDRPQAAALAEYMAQVGVRRLTLLTDRDETGLGLLRLVAAGARSRGIAVGADVEVDARTVDPREPVAQIRRGDADAVLYAGSAQGGAVARLWRALAAGDPSLKLFASSGLADPSFVAAVGLAGESTYVTRPLLALGAYPPAARRFARAFMARYGSRPRPEALYGYAAMEAVLGAIRRAESGPGGLRRGDVVRELFRTRQVGGVLGAYAIDRAGDTSLRRFGAYRIAAGRLSYEHPLVG